MGVAIASDGAAKRDPRVDAAAGALAGTVARLIVGPLDVVKIRFQVQLEPIRRAALSAGATLPSHYTGFVNAFRTIVKEEGIQGLWRGTVPGLLLTVPYTAVQFLALQQCKDAAAALGWSGQSSTLVSLGSGALAGAAATLASYPFDLLRTTLAAQGEPKVYRGMLDAAAHIRKEHGVRGLYRGMSVTLLEIMPYAALQFGLYDALNIAWNQTRAAWEASSTGSDAGSSAGGDGGGSSSVGRRSPVRDGDSRLQYFACGLLAGLMAKLATHPLDVAKKRFQVAGLQRSLRYGARIGEQTAHTSLVACLGHIYRAEGLAGLWKGSLPSILKAAPNAAITFTVYELAIAAAVSASGEAGGGAGGGEAGAAQKQRQQRG